MLCIQDVSKVLIFRDRLDWRVSARHNKLLRALYRNVFDKSRILQRSVPNKSCDELCYFVIPTRHTNTPPPPNPGVATKYLFISSSYFLVGSVRQR